MFMHPGFVLMLGWIAVPQIMAVITTKVLFDLVASGSKLK
jgi:hypothetical protein